MKILWIYKPGIFLRWEGNKSIVIYWTDYVLYGQIDYFSFCFHWWVAMWYCSQILVLLRLNFLIYKIEKVTDGTEEWKDVIIT